MNGQPCPASERTVDGSLGAALAEARAEKVPRSSVTAAAIQENSEGFVSFTMESPTTIFDTFSLGYSTKLSLGLRRRHIRDLEFDIAKPWRLSVVGDMVKKRR